MQNNFKFLNQNSLVKPILIIVAVLLIIFGIYSFFSKSDDVKSGSKSDSKNQFDTEIKSSGIDSDKDVDNVGDVEEVIAKWIEANPEAILNSVANMQKKMMEEQAKNAQKTIGDKKSEIYSNKAPSHSPKGYDVTIVEFYDYNCGYCKRANATIEQLIKEDKKVRVIFRDFPILGQASEELAKVSIAADMVDPSKFTKFHNKLMDSQASTKEDAIKVAVQSGINESKLRKVLSDKDSKIMEIINKNRELGSSVGIQGTPAFVIGEELIPGAIDLGTLKAKINASR